MKRIALFPGTFDPPSLGHLDVIQRASSLFDQLIIAVSLKLEKKNTAIFSAEEKIAMLQKITETLPNVTIESFSGLVVDFAKKKKALFLIRGLRPFSDFEYEFQMALANRRLSGIETLFLPAAEEYAQVSSSLIREIAYFGGPISPFVPPAIEPLIRKKFSSSV